MIVVLYIIIIILLSKRPYMDKITRLAQDTTYKEGTTKVYIHLGDGVDTHY